MSLYVGNLSYLPLVVSKYVEPSLDVVEYIEIVVGDPVILLDSSDCEVKEVVTVVIEVVSEIFEAEFIVIDGVFVTGIEDDGKFSSGVEALTVIFGLIVEVVKSDVEKVVLAVVRIESVVIVVIFIVIEVVGDIASGLEELNVTFRLLVEVNKLEVE